MASRYDALARICIQNVGGKENIISVAHCVTRLRFRLKDESKANDEVLENTDGVLQILKAGGQYQIVIGPQVGDVYDAVLAVGHLSGAGEVDIDGNPIEGGDDGGKKSFTTMLMDLISGIIHPTLGVLASAGMIQGLLALFRFMGWMSDTDGAYQVLYSVGNGFFYFLPIMLGYTSAKKFGCNEFVGAAMGAGLCFPAMVNSTSGDILGTVLAGTPFAMNYYQTFFGIPIIMPASGYTSTIVPIVVSVFVVSKIEHGFKNIMPAAVSFFMTPLLTLVIGISLTYLIIGPVISALTAIVLMFFNSLYALPVVGGAVAGTVLGALWQVLVIFGLHWALLPLKMSNLANIGYDTILAPNFGATFCQITVCFVIYLKTRDQKVKDMALPAIITGFFGTTEPAIYGITLPRMKPFILSCIGSACGGLFIGIMGARCYSTGYSGIVGISTFIDPTGARGLDDAMIIIGGILISMVVGFILAWIFWDERGWAEKNAKGKKATA